MLTKFGWIARPCPDSTETSCGKNYLYRSCLYRSQGFYLRPEDAGVQNKLLFRLILTFSFWHYFSLGRIQLERLNKLIYIIE